MITAVILAKNEEKNIEKCIKSLFFCNEILVIDDNSTDNTVSLAKKYKARVIIHPLNKDFSAQRNFALSMVKTEWALFVDADEQVPPKLAAEIKSSMYDAKSNGFYIKRQDELFGKTLKYGELLNKKFIKLGRVGKGRWVGRVHEKWEILGSVATLENPLIHMPHQTIGEFISEIDFYTTLRAEELYRDGVKSSFVSIILYTVLKFLHTYFLKRGFMDGVPGIIMAYMMSLHSFLTRSKLFMLQQKK